MGFCHLFPILLFAFFDAFFIQISHSYSFPSFEACSPSTCNTSTIKYPFGTGECNTYAYVDCPNNQSTLLYNIYLGGTCYEYNYSVLGGITQSSYSTQTIRIALDNTHFDVCSSSFTCSPMYEYDFPFQLSDKYKWGTVLICTTEPPYKTNPQSIQCLECRSPKESCFFLPSSLPRENYSDICRKYRVVVPASKNYNISDEKNLQKLLQTGFEIKWNISGNCPSCEASGGRCVSPYYATDGYAVCICTDGPHEQSCLDGKPINHKKRWKIPRYVAAISVVSGILITATIINIYFRVNAMKTKQREEEQDMREYMDPLHSRPPSVEDFLHRGIPTRYSYAQIKRYTNNFVDRLGQGGFGTVYKGKIPNECLVAIKILNKTKHSSEQFMNEVSTVGRIHHLHLVRLLGYCYEGSKRALVYEYMVNGSLEKYIHRFDRNALEWKQLYSIAMGTARGIAYLHDECSSRILHCDIKPHNVLLDANFSPKVADFGLAKLTDRKESHVSLTGVRGTPGYVAPEVWSRNYGPVSDKSDVYSYGMLIMEMVGGRKNFDMQGTRSSKFLYPEWAFKQVEMGEFGRLREGNITNEEDENIAKKLSLLGLWCIQFSASQRPSMSRVIQMLEGTVDITIPPHPFPMDTVVQTTASTELSSTSSM